MAETKKKKLLGIDQESYEYYKRIEKEILEELKQLEQYANITLGKKEVDNWKQYLDNPVEYLVNNYWMAYCTHLPNHLDKIHTWQQQTRLNEMQIKATANNFWRLVDQMREHKPIINASGVTVNVKKESFSIYLDQSKQDHYNALNNVLRSIEKLKKYSKLNAPNFLSRYVPELIIDTVKNDVKIDITVFKE